MKRPRKPSLIAIVLLMAGACLGQSTPNGDVAHQFHVRIAQLSLQQFSTDKLVIGVGLAANASRNVTVDELVLSGLQLNGVPIYAAPVKHRFKVRSDGSIMLPEQLQVTVYLRDLDSLKPLRDAIANGYATLSCIAVVRVPLNPLQRLMLLSSHAEVSISLDQQVALSIPGGRVTSTSLIKILDLAEAAFKSLDSTITSATKPGGK